MATQTTKGSEQPNQSAQGQGGTRGSQQQSAQSALASRRSAYALGLPVTPAEFLRMSPFSLMRRMSEEFDRLLAEGNGREQVERAWAPAVEVISRDGNYTVRAELAGLKPEDVKLEITDDAIVLQGERKEEHEETKEGIHMTERRYGRFYRAIPLPEGAKTDEARARFENGVLEVTVPTEEQKSKNREIPIQGSSQAGSPVGKAGASSESAGGSEKAA
jgi:HSP20 family protein